MQLDQQWHGYRRGHQLLASTTDLSPRDQDLIDKLSDASGSPRPGEVFDPYLTIYPLPSGGYHVIARTWQDVEAARSGTVFTRSLLVPRESWRTMRSLRPLVEALSSRDMTEQPVTIQEARESWPPVTDPNVYVLAEALFLERAAAIAAFGFTQKELVSSRLLEALWPARRETMAICTYSLGPRSLPDRDFDLVFAPETARSRFAKWQGRKVNASTGTAPARHEWTGQIVNRVFLDPHPSLAELDEIGALDEGARGDTSALRLALLWGELRRKAATSPTSLLGMLDILSSLSHSPSVVPGFNALVIRALNITDTIPPTDAWRFLQLLVRKLDGQMPLSVVRAISNAAGTLAVRSPSVISDGIADTAAMPLAHLLRPAVARGLAQLTEAELAVFLKAVPSPALLSLMSESPVFTAAVARSLSTRADDDIINPLAKCIADDNRAARRVVGGVARSARSSAVAPLLAAAISSAPPSNFEMLAWATLSAGGSGRTTVIDALIRASHAVSKEDELRRLSINAPDRADGDQILIRLVSGRVATAWLVEELSSDRERLFPILLQLMARWSDADLREGLREGRTKDDFFEAAVTGLPGSGQAFVRLLSIVSPNPVTTTALVRRAFPKLSVADRSDALASIIDQMLVLEPSSIGDLLDAAFATLDPRKLIIAATSTSLSGEQVGRNIAAIAQSSAVARFVPLTDGITARLVERRSGGYGPSGYDGWARMLRLARQLHPEALVLSADAALDYALARPNEPGGGIVAACFPIVHARLKKDSLPDLPFNFIAAILIVSLSIFTDWDRAKAARHGIVDKFLKSKWDPVELLRAGVDAGIPRKVLGYLVSKPGGREYLRRIENGVGAYPQPARAALAAALSEFKSSSS